MQSKLWNPLVLSALMMAMSATSANAVQLTAAEFRKTVDAYHQNKNNAQMTVHSLSKEKGKYGEILSQQGWNLDSTPNIRDIPNNPSTLVYVNVDNIPDLAAAVSFFENFQGVIVIDSHQIAETLSGYDYTFKSEKSNASTLEAGYNRLLAKSTKISPNFAPVATAVIVQMRTKKITPLNIDVQKNVNGIVVGRIEEFIHLKNYTYTNAKLPTPLEMVKGGANEKPTPEHNQYVELTEQVDGILAVASILFNASADKLAAGETVNNWRTDTIVFTGADGRACMNGGIKCGIYPETEKSILSVTSDPINGQKNVRSYLTKHGAYIKAFGSSKVLESTINTEEWANPALIDDREDVAYVVGDKFGLDVIFNPKSVPIPSKIRETVSYSFLANKIHSPAWKGEAVIIEDDYDPKLDAATQDTTEVVNTVTLQDGHKEETDGVFLAKGTFDQVYLKKILGSIKEDKLSPNIKNCAHGDGEVKVSPRSGMMFEGWQPSVHVTHQFDKDTSSFTSEGDAGKIQIQAGLQWARANATYYPVLIKCFKKRGIFRKAQVVNYLAYTKVRGSASLNSVSTNKKQIPYARGVTIQVYHKGFPVPPAPPAP